MEDLSVRIAALERSNRRMRALLAFAALAAIPLLLGAWQSPKQVPDKLQAKSFELVDDKGAVLAKMEAYEGSGALTTYNGSGKMLVDVVPTKSGAGGIVVYDGNGHQNIKVTDVKGGGGSIVLNNELGVGVMTLGHSTVSSGSVTLANKDAKTICLITSDTTGAGAMLTYDTDGKQTGRLPSGSNTQGKP